MQYARLSQNDLAGDAKGPPPKRTSRCQLVVALVVALLLLSLPTSGWLSSRPHPHQDDSGSKHASAMVPGPQGKVKYALALHPLGPHSVGEPALYGGVKGGLS